MGILQLLMSGGAGGEKKYIDDFFNIDLWNGNYNTTPAPININNGIDLVGDGDHTVDGGLVWTKSVNINANSHQLYDTLRGAGKPLYSNIDNSEGTNTVFGSFNSNGFSLTAGTWGTDPLNGDSNCEYVGWTFRRSLGFFDIVTWTGVNAPGTSGVSNISHNLGCNIGAIIAKRINAAGAWHVWHKSFGSNPYLLELQSTQAVNTGSDAWGSSPSITNSQFSVDGRLNDQGGEYVAYLFADGDDSDAQIFGENEDQSVVKCGLVQMDASGYIPDVELGFEPQWMMYKAYDATAVSSSGGNWDIMDVNRRWNIRNGSDGGNMDPLRANLNNVEGSGAGGPAVRSTGFGSPAAVNFGSNAQYVYIAIRRDMKPAEDATKVFSAGTRSGSGSVAKTTSTVFTDMSITCRLDSAAEYNSLNTRLLWNETFKTTNQDAYNTGLVSAWDTMTAGATNVAGMYVTASNGAANTGNLVDYSFKRQPGFFDVAVYDGDASNNPVTVYHNLGVSPELIISKCDTLSTTGEWRVIFPTSGTIPSGSNAGSNYDFITGYLSRSHSFGWNVYNANFDLSQAVTATTITYAGNSSGGNADVNYAGRSYTNYLFASKSKVSAIGQYTGTGSAVNVDCGFDAAARFILIKRIALDPLTDAGDWYLYDSARGIVVGNDPYYLLNEEAAEVTGTDYIDPYASGFTVTSSAPAALNGTGTYLYLAIA